MSPQISEDFLSEVFVETDDLYKSFYTWACTYAPSCVFTSKRPFKLSPAEIATITIGYHVSGYKCFEYYYKECIKKQYLHCFPTAPSYKRFVSLIIWVLPLLLLLLLHKCGQSVRTGHYFIDSKKLEVCRLLREKSHKVFEGFASKGKSSTGWFFGLKLHVVINHLGQIVTFLITPGSVADNNHGVLTNLLSCLVGKCGGDRGYQTTLFSAFLEQGLHLVVRPKKNMKSKSIPALPADMRFLRQRAVIESTYDILGTICDVEHSRHRNPRHGLANVFAALIAYQYLPIKPHVFIPGAPNYLSNAA